MESRKRKILVVDDNVAFVDFVRRSLQMENYQISTAFDGQTAIKKALIEVPELILLDLRLPDLPGEKVLEIIKENNKDIAVIVITGYGGEQVAVDMMRKGAIDFFSKPVEYEVLSKAVKSALEINDAKMEDQELNQYPSLERFFPFLAHEVRNPLHAISGALAIIQRRSDSQDELLSQSIKIIDEEVQHLNNFVQECLNFVRPTDVVRFTEVDINEVVSVIVNMVSHMFEFESKQIKIAFKGNSGLPKIYANYEEIKQAFVNIARNAFEAMPEGGELTIKTSHQLDNPNYIEVVFTDNGSGIKKENMKFLFKPFFTTKLRGTGLGLSICRRIIVERHHGKIDVESEEDRGMMVKIELPIGHQFGDQ